MSKNLEILDSKRTLSQEFFQRFSNQEMTLITAWVHAKSPQTQRLYKRVVRDFFLSFSEIGLKDVELGHGLVFLKNHGHLKLSSQNLIRDVLCSLFSFCVKSGYLDKSPFISLERFKTPDVFGSKVLSEADIKRMIDKEKNIRNRLILKLLYESGIRVNELAKIRMGDFSLRPDGNALLMVIGKGSKIRGVVIRKKIMDEIDDYLTQLSLPQKDDDFLLPAKKAQGQPLATPQIYRIVRNAAKRAGIDKKVSPHWFRHSSATHALERGAPIHVVKATLGHESLTTTGKYLERRPNQSNSDFLPEL